MIKLTGQFSNQYRHIKTSNGNTIIFAGEHNDQF